MQLLSFGQISVDEILSDELKRKNINLFVLRLDKIHPVISGNKWFKLKYWIEDAKAKNKERLLSFGGAYSNHIVAVAAAGKLHGLKTTGVIRGEQPAILSVTLQQAMKNGMELVFISRENYRDKKLPVEMSEEIYIINEGGYGPLGVKGAAEILDCCKKEDYTHICCAGGTTTMMAGLITAVLQQQEVIGLPVLKNPSAEIDLRGLLTDADQKKKFSFIHDYHFGGYAKKTEELIKFMNALYKATGIPSDFVYTGKLFFGVFDLIKKNFFKEGSRLLMIHSGGLQGNLSLPKDLLIF
jgi:1-aminocyclopropane-1-carboxylate deaminase/D-cysteine desulfhydrase-like pyridoxal-dependent ACC family enzyme